jgi:hypothetical protein
VRCASGSLMIAEDDVRLADELADIGAEHVTAPLILPVGIRGWMEQTPVEEEAPRQSPARCSQNGLARTQGHPTQVQRGARPRSRDDKWTLPSASRR